MLTLQPAWFTSAVNSVAHVLIIAWAVWVIWRHRDQRPRTSQWLIVAAVISLIDVVLHMLETSHIIVLAPQMFPAQRTQLLANQATLGFLGWQASKACLKVLFWGVVAWAIFGSPASRAANRTRD